MLPAILVIFCMKKFLLVLLRRNVALPLLLTITVLPTHPAVKIRLRVVKTCGPSVVVSECPVTLFNQTLFSESQVRT